MTAHETLASFLDLPMEEIQEWSDGSFTISNHIEYELHEEPIDYCDLAGELNGYYIYKTQWK